MQEPAGFGDVGREMKRARWRRLLPLLGVLAFAAAVFLVWGEVRPFGVSGMWQAVVAIPRGRFALAALTAALSYAVLTLFDWLGLRYAGHPLSYRRAALASFVALSIGHSVGLAPLGSAALRARYYAQWGLDAEAISKVILFSAATVTIGEVALAGIVLLVEPHPAAAFLHLGDAVVRLASIACLAAITAYLAAARGVRQPLTIRRWRVALLTATLHFLILSAAPLSYWTTAAIYLLASVAALVSHVPGGLGVAEFVVLASLPGAGT